MWIKTTLRLHLTPVKMVASSTPTPTNAGEDVRIEEPLYAAGRNWIRTSTVENSMEAPQKIKTRTAVWSSNSTLRDTPKVRLQQSHLHTHVYCSAIHNSSQDAPPLTNGLRKYGIYTQWNCVQPFVICR
jgi:hypothetical protein